MSNYRYLLELAELISTEHLLERLAKVRPLRRISRSPTELVRSKQIAFYSEIHLFFALTLIDCR